MKPDEIKKRRKALGWSQAELGAKLGLDNPVSAKTLVSKYEKASRPERLVSEERLQEIDKILTAEERLRAEFAAFKAGKGLK